MKTAALCIVTGLLSLSALAQQWMGPRLTNTAIFLDPTEVQVSGSINGLLSKDLSESQYLPFSIGGSQSIVGKKTAEHSWEFIGELGVFTQFEWETVADEQQRNLINTDYRIAFSYIHQNTKRTWRIRFFHVSSHLGDDYLIRNQVRHYSTNKVNYEQLDINYFKQLNPHVRLYLGAGSVVRPNSLRLPFSFQAGSHYNSKTAEESGWGWTSGFFLKNFQETDFTPNLKLGVGPAYYLSSKAEPVRIIIEYYTGYLPYSQYENSRIEWLGMGLYFYL
jgi:hypothetical protein